MNPGRGRPDSPPEPPATASKPISAPDDGDEYAWDEDEDPSDRATLIPPEAPDEALLLRASQPQIEPLQVTVPPPLRTTAPPLPGSVPPRGAPPSHAPSASARGPLAPTVPPFEVDDAADVSWDEPSAIIERSAERSSMPELELDLDDLGPPSVNIPSTPRGPGKAKPISLLPPPPVVTTPAPVLAATARPAPPPVPTRPAGPPPVPTRPAGPPSPSLAAAAGAGVRAMAVTRRDLSAAIPRELLRGEPERPVGRPPLDSLPLEASSAPDLGEHGAVPPSAPGSGPRSNGHETFASSAEASSLSLALTPPHGIPAVEMPVSSSRLVRPKGPLFRPPTPAEGTPEVKPPSQPRPPSQPHPSANLWEPIRSSRQSMPTLLDDDPLSHDLQEALQSPQRIQFTDEFEHDLDLGALRNPKMPVAMPSPSLPPLGPEDSPGTAPYPVDEQRFPTASAYVPGQLRASSAVASAPDTIHGLSELNADTLEEEVDILTSARPTLMGHQPPPADPLQRALRDMRDKFALGDFSGSLKAAESVLAIDPNHADGQRYADTCRQRLRAMYEAKLGSLSKVPRVALPPDQVRWLSLDHRAGFILSCVDGYSAIEEILDVSGMSALDALRILCDLLQQKVIAVA